MIDTMLLFLKNFFLGGLSQLLLWLRLFCYHCKCVLSRTKKKKFCFFIVLNKLNLFIKDIFKIFIKIFEDLQYYIFENLYMVFWGFVKIFSDVEPLGLSCSSILLGHYPRNLIRSWHYQWKVGLEMVGEGVTPSDLLLY